MTSHLGADTAPELGATAGPRTIAAALDYAGSAYADRIAVVDEAGERLTYPDLVAAARRIGAALVGSGIQHGDRVAIWAPNSVSWIISVLGIWDVGAVLVPLNTRYKQGEAAHVLRSSGAQLLLTTSGFLGIDYAGMALGSDDLPDLAEVVLFDGSDQIDGATAWRTFVDRAEKAMPLLWARESAVVEDDVADVLYTSGTTGVPKGVMLTHGSTVEVYGRWARALGLSGNDRYYLVAPFFHMFGLKSGILACVLTGAAMYPRATFNVESMLSTIADERITTLAGPPTIFQELLDNPRRHTIDMSCLQRGQTGATLIPAELIRRMREDLGIPTVLSGYGLTECTGIASLTDRDDPPEVIAGTVGKPLPGFELRIVDPSGAELPPGEVGEVWMRSPLVMKGYFRDPAATSEAIDSQGWLRSGDLGRIDAGGHLVITGRKKDMFIVGGFNAYPAEIEGMLRGCPSVVDVSVVGVPDSRLGEVGFAFVILSDEATFDAAGFGTWCRAVMANFKVPRHVLVVSELPVNAAGKVLKDQLCIRAAEALSLGTSIAVATT